VDCPELQRGSPIIEQKELLVLRDVFKVSTFGLWVHLWAGEAEEGQLEVLISS
jgi:hypothetical protein